jgi:C1A family cysteine protease
MLALLKRLWRALFPAPAESAAPDAPVLGWKPEVADPRDRAFAAPLGLGALPTSVDLRPRFAPVETQGAINSCVAHAMTSAFEFVTGVTDRSRLHVYWIARAVEGSTRFDAGCFNRSAAKALAASGAGAEPLWPYDVTKVKTAPPASVAADALKSKGLIASYERVTDLAGVKAALASGLPVVFGFSVPDYFMTETRSTGHLRLNTGSPVIGGHSVLAVGYDDASGNVIVRNSFGPAFGLGGYFTMPYSWFQFGSLVDDGWVLRPKA